MRLAYLDCFSGVSGNMLLAAVIDAGVSPRALRGILKSVVVDFRLLVREDTSQGLPGARVRVECRKKQPERRLHQIQKMILNSGLPAPVVNQSLEVFKTLARAEAKVHRVLPEEIHFHEVGAVDAIVDVVGTVAGLHQLKVDEVVCSPLPLSGGEVKCAHGILPLPAPAVLELIKGLPVTGAPGDQELVTPTGAALVVTLASRFGPLPAMTIEGYGVGLGDHELADRPNLMRLILGTAPGQGERLIQFETAIDDMNPERFAFLIEKLHEAGALEALLIPAQMKKNRPGVLVRILLRPRDRDRVSAALLNHSTTLGFREHEVQRTSLTRESLTVETRFGKLRVKCARRPDGSARWHPESDDLSRAAQKAGVSLETVELEAMRAVPKPGRRKS